MRSQRPSPRPASPPAGSPPSPPASRKPRRRWSKARSRRSPEARAQTSTGNRSRTGVQRGSGGHVDVNPAQQVSYTTCLGCTTYVRRARAHRQGDRPRPARRRQSVQPLSTDPHLPMKAIVRESLAAVSAAGRSGLRGPLDRLRPRRRRAGADDHPVPRHRRRSSASARAAAGGGSRSRSSSWSGKSSKAATCSAKVRCDGLRAHPRHEPIDAAQPELGPSSNQVAVLSIDQRRAREFRPPLRATGLRHHQLRRPRHLLRRLVPVRLRRRCSATSSRCRMPSPTSPMPSSSSSAARRRPMPAIPSSARAGSSRAAAPTASSTMSSSIRCSGIPIRSRRRHRGRWIPIRPATDGALALAMIRWIIDNERYDEKFLVQPNAKAASRRRRAVVVERHPSGRRRAGPSARGLLPARLRSRPRRRGRQVRRQGRLRGRRAADRPPRRPRPDAAGGRAVRRRSLRGRRRQLAPASRPWTCCATARSGSTIAEYAAICGIPADIDRGPGEGIHQPRQARRGEHPWRHHGGQRLLQCLRAGDAEHADRQPERQGRHHGDPAAPFRPTATGRATISPASPARSRRRARRCRATCPTSASSEFKAKKAAGKPYPARAALVPGRAATRHRMACRRALTAIPMRSRR